MEATLNGQTISFYLGEREGKQTMLKQATILYKLNS